MKSPKEAVRADDGETYSPVLSYSVAIVSIAAATLLRWLLDPVLLNAVPSITVFGAVAASVWFGGYGIAAVVAIVGYVVSNYLFIEPRGAFSLNDAQEILGFFLYAVTCTVIIVFGEALHSARRRAEAGRRDALARQQELEREIAERRQIQAALERSEARLAAILEQLPAGVGVIDRDGQMVSGNSMMRRMVGRLVPSRDPEQMGRWRGLDADGKPLGASDWPIARALRGEAVSPGMEFVHTDEKGRQFWTRVAAVPFRADDGAIDGAVAVIQDIDDEKKAEQSLRESEQRLRLALEAGRMGTWEWNIKTNQVVWSPGLEQIHGLGSGVFDGSFDAFQKDIHPDDRADVLDRIAETVQQGRDHYIEYRIVLPDRSVRWVEGRGKISRRESGVPTAMIGVCADITERKQAEQRLNLVAQEIEHRGRNILAMVRAMIQMTRADTMAEFTRVLNSRIDGIARTHSLLSANHYRSAELGRLFEQELGAYASEPEGKVQMTGPDLSLSPKPAESLAMVIHELTTNAAKYGALSRSGGALAVEWAALADGRIRIDWIETGGALSTETPRQGFGTRLVTAIVQQQLSGNITFHWLRDGLHCRLDIPAHAVLAGTDEPASVAWLKRDAAMRH